MPPITSDRSFGAAILPTNRSVALDPTENQPAALWIAGTGGFCLRLRLTKNRVVFRLPLDFRMRSRPPNAPQVPGPNF
jgi:hypothetical protein